MVYDSSTTKVLRLAIKANVFFRI